MPPGILVELAVPPGNSDSPYRAVTGNAEVIQLSERGVTRPLITAFAGNRPGFISSLFAHANAGHGACPLVLARAPGCSGCLVFKHDVPLVTASGRAQLRILL